MEFQLVYRLSRFCFGLLLEKGNVSANVEISAGTVVVSNKIAIFGKKVWKYFGGSEIYSTFALAFREMHFKKLLAEIAQLVEHDLAKVGVAGSSPVFRSAYWTKA